MITHKGGCHCGRVRFEVVAPAACGPEIEAILAEQRAALPHPEQRIAMRRAQSG